jgi:hypothetical protein
MGKRLFVLSAVCCLAYPPVLTQEGSRQGAIRCRAMEVFTARQLGTTAVIFHQLDKADAPSLSELLKAYSASEVEFETRDGRKHRATIMRMKTCFGRGLLLFPSGEAGLGENDEFMLRFPARN